MPRRWLLGQSAELSAATPATVPASRPPAVPPPSVAPPPPSTLAETHVGTSSSVPSTPRHPLRSTWSTPLDQQVTTAASVTPEQLVSRCGKRGTRSSPASPCQVGATRPPTTAPTKSSVHHRQRETRRWRKREPAAAKMVKSLGRRGSGCLLRFVVRSRPTSDKSTNSSAAKMPQAAGAQKNGLHHGSIRPSEFPARWSCSPCSVTGYVSRQCMSHMSQESAAMRIPLATRDRYNGISTSSCSTPVCSLPRRSPVTPTGRSR